MKLLKSLGRSIKAMAGAVMKPAEDPHQAISNPYERQQELLEQVRIALVHLGQARRRLQANLNRTDRKQRKLEQAARMAVVGGKEDEAREAIRQRHSAQPGLDALRQRLSQVLEQERGLRMAEKQLASRLKDFRFESEIVRVRWAAEVRLDHALTGTANEFPHLALALEQAQLESQQVESDSAIDRLVGLLEVTHGAEVGEHLDDSVERELATLRSQLQGLEPAAGSLPVDEKERT